MARTTGISNLTRDALLLAIKDLIARKRIAPTEITAALARRQRIDQLERELATLRGGGGARRAATGTASAAGAKPKRKIRNTAKLRAARKLQGQYMGRLRKLTGKNRSAVKATAKKDGVPAAIKLANKLLQK